MTIRMIETTASADAHLVLRLGPPPLVPHTEIVRAALAVTVDPADGGRLHAIEILDFAVAARLLRALAGADGVQRLAEWKRELIFSHRDFGRRELTLDWDDRIATILGRRAELDWLDRLSPCDLPRSALQLERGLLALDSGVDELAEIAAVDALDGAPALERLRSLLEGGATAPGALTGRVIESAERHPGLIGPPELVAAVRRAWDAALTAASEVAAVDWATVLASAADAGPAVEVRELAGARDTARRDPIDYLLPLDRLHIERGVLPLTGAYSRVFAVQWEDRTGGRMSVAVRVSGPVEHGDLRVRVVREDGSVGYDGPLAPIRPTMVQAVFAWPQPLRPGESVEVYSPSLDVGPDDPDERDAHLLEARVAEALQFERLALSREADRAILLDRADRAWDAARETAEFVGMDVAWIGRLDDRRANPVPAELSLAEELLGR